MKEVTAHSIVIVINFLTESHTYKFSSAECLIIEHTKATSQIGQPLMMLGAPRTAPATLSFEACLPIYTTYIKMLLDERRKIYL